MRKTLCFLMLIAAGFISSASTAPSEIKVDLKLCSSDYVSGERIRAIVDIANSSPDKISVGYSNSEDFFFIEVFRASDMKQLQRVYKRDFV